MPTNKWHKKGPGRALSPTGALRAEATTSLIEEHERFRKDMDEYLQKISGQIVAFGGLRIVAEKRNLRELLFPENEEERNAT